MREMVLQTPMPHTSMPHTSMPHTSMPHTSMPHTSMAIPHTSMPQTSLLSVAHQAQPLYGVADYSELHKDAPMTSLGVDELEDLLHRLKLLDYLEAFRENGCDQVADVALMRESDLREIGMKLGHIRRLLQHFEGGARR